MNYKHLAIQPAELLQEPPDSNDSEQGTSLAILMTDGIKKFDKTEPKNSIDMDSTEPLCLARLGAPDIFPPIC